jgi:hypothetical protein
MAGHIAMNGNAPDEERRGIPKVLKRCGLREGRPALLPIVGPPRLPGHPATRPPGLPPARVGELGRGMGEGVGVGEGEGFAREGMQ